MIEIKQTACGHEIVLNGISYARIPGLEGATDSFQEIESGAWKWHRHTETPTDHMRMEMILLGEPTFTMIPAVSYNGNGWGDLPEYVGDRAEDGTPWSFASHRATIPACTYSENDAISVALMAEADSNTACSFYQVPEGRKHVVIFPEEERPKALHRHFWGEPFQGTMEPQRDFEAVIFTAPSAGSQDEAICHTRWGRNSTPPFFPTQWLAAWPCAFRLENLRWHEDWSFFDEGLCNIEGKIEK